MIVSKLGAFGDLRTHLRRDLRNNAVARRDKRVFHLHRFHHRHPLALCHGCALLDQQRKHLSVHRRAHGSVAVLMLGVDILEIRQPHGGLPALAQDEYAAITFDDHAPPDRRHCRPSARTARDDPKLTRHIALLPSTTTGIVVSRRPDKLEAVDRVPGRRRHIRITARGDALLLALEQMRDAGGDHRRIGFLRYRAQRVEIAVDEAGVEIAGAEIPGAAQAGQKREIGARARRRCVRSSASASRSSAFSRVGACAITLAIIGS